MHWSKPNGKSLNWRTGTGYEVCRFRRIRSKDIYLTRGDLFNHGSDWEKSAEAIVATGNEPRIETVEVSQRSEGLNVRFVHNSIRKLLGLSQSSLILNKDRRLFGAKSEKLIPGEPLYTRPAWFTLSDSRSVKWCERRTGYLWVVSRLLDWQQYFLFSQF